MSETTTRDMADQLTDTLNAIVHALHGAGVATERPTEVAVTEDIIRWQAIVWRAADLIADPMGPARAAWSRTVGLEHAAREWVHAADVYILYRGMAAPWRELVFERHMGSVTSNLHKQAAGLKWDVRG